MMQNDKNVIRISIAMHIFIFVSVVCYAKYRD